MRLHPREVAVQAAAADFKIRWAKLDQSQAQTFAEFNLAFNAVDLFWSTADLNERKLKDAAAAWERHPLDLLPESLRDFTRKVGNELAAVVTEHELTYGEIMQILANERLSSSKYHIREERYPDDSDKPVS